MKRTLCVGDLKWTPQRAERRVKPKQGTVPVPCPLEGCTKMYHWDEELVSKLPKDGNGLPDFFEYWGDHYGQFNLVTDPKKPKSFKGIRLAVKNHCKGEHKMLLACCKKLQGK